MRALFIVGLLLLLAGTVSAVYTSQGVLNNVVLLEHDKTVRGGGEYSVVEGAFDGQGYLVPGASTPFYAGDKHCSLKEDRQCENACLKVGPKGNGDGNWFLNSKCKRIDHPDNPTHPTKYFLECKCNWVDAGWNDDGTVATTPFTPCLVC